MSARNLKILVIKNQFVNNNNSKAVTIFDDNDDTMRASELTLTKSTSSAGSLTITIQPSHPNYSYGFTLIGTVCFVYLNIESPLLGTNEPFFVGRLYDESIDLFGNKTLVFEGLLSRLATFPISGELLTLEPSTFFDTVKEIRRAYNSNCGTQQFKEDASNYIDDMKSSSYKIDLSDLGESDTLYSALQYVMTKFNNLITEHKYYMDTSGAYGNYLFPRFYDNIYPETVKLNMVTDYGKNINGESFANCIFAYGKEADNGTRPFVQVYDQTSIDTVGVVAKRITYDNCTSTTKLQGYADRALARAMKNTVHWSIGIVDKYAVNGDYSHFGVGDQVNVVGSGYVDSLTAYVEERTYDFLNPLNDSIKIERTKKKLTSQL